MKRNRLRPVSATKKCRDIVVSDVAARKKCQDMIVSDAAARECSGVAPGINTKNSVYRYGRDRRCLSRLVLSRTTIKQKTIIGRFAKK